MNKNIIVKTLLILNLLSSPVMADGVKVDLDKIGLAIYGKCIMKVPEKYQMEKYPYVISNNLLYEETDDGILNYLGFEKVHNILKKSGIDKYKIDTRSTNEGKIAFNVKVDDETQVPIVQVALSSIGIEITNDFDFDPAEELAKTDLYNSCYIKAAESAISKIEKLYKGYKYKYEPLELDYESSRYLSDDTYQIVVYTSVEIEKED